MRSLPFLSTCLSVLQGTWTAHSVLTMSYRRGNIIKQSDDRYQSHFIIAEPAEENGQGGYLRFAVLKEKKKTSNPVYVSNGSISLSAIWNSKKASEVLGEMFRPAVGSHRAYSGVKGNQSSSSTALFIQINLGGFHTAIANCMFSSPEVLVSGLCRARAALNFCRT